MLHGFDCLFLRLEDITDDRIFAIWATYLKDWPELGKEEQAIHRDHAERQDNLYIVTIALLIIFAVLVTPLSSATAASCDRECCKGRGAQDEAEKSCKAGCPIDARHSGGDSAQPGENQTYKDIKCYNACVKSGYKCKYCEDNCSYCK